MGSPGWLGLIPIFSLDSYIKSRIKRILYSFLETISYVKKFPSLIKQKKTKNKEICKSGLVMRNAKVRRTQVFKYAKH